jgi:tRNA/tmRNA/rRNA uracil-C5-methylase (TrmA/RlmC/RlmD family)
VIINVGAGTGNYAIGLAQRIPSVLVLAYEYDQETQEILRRNIQLNNVEDRVTILGKCDLTKLEIALNQSSDQKVLVIVDCEGCEFDLLDPNLIEGITNADLLVEIHFHMYDDEKTTFLNRFIDSHEIQLIDVEVREPDDYPELSTWKQKDRELALLERWPPNGDWQWGYFMKKKK